MGGSLIRRVSRRHSSQYTQEGKIVNYFATQIAEFICSMTIPAELNRITPPLFFSLKHPVPRNPTEFANFRCSRFTTRRISEPC
jgi:hypothetical protein